MAAQRAPRVASGIPGLDSVMHGGFDPYRLYLVEGTPGSGKTTFAMQFLLEGARNGEPVLHVTLSETEEEARAAAESHGWSLDGVTIRQLGPDEGSLAAQEQYTVFHPSEVELTETTRRILADVERIRPTRVVFDSLSELRLLAGSALRYRRQILAFKQYFAGRRSTVLMLDDRTAEQHDLQVQSIAHGVFLLEHHLPDYGAMRRRLTLSKYRGSDFRGGYHDYVIRRGGIEVFPRLVAAEHRQPVERERMRSGIAEIDKLLGGGIERGTSTLVQGAAGTGKSTVCALFAAEAAKKGQHASLFIFDESTNTLFSRMDGLGVDLRGYAEAGKIRVQEIDPAELTPGEFSHAIRRAVDDDGSRLVVIDSLNGYLNSMPDERFLVIQMHELLSYLGQRSVATLLVSAQQGLFNANLSAPVDASYLADAVLYMRYFEVEGEVRQAMSVVKMRGGYHERTIREFRIEDGRVRVGEPLRDLHGVLSGAPQRRG